MSFKKWLTEGVNELNCRMTIKVDSELLNNLNFILSDEQRAKILAMDGNPLTDLEKAQRFLKWLARNADEDTLREVCTVFEKLSRPRAASSLKIYFRWAENQRNTTSSATSTADSESSQQEVHIQVPTPQTRVNTRLPLSSAPSTSSSALPESAAEPFSDLEALVSAGWEVDDTKQFLAEHPKPYNTKASLDEYSLNEQNPVVSKQPRKNSFWEDEVNKFKLVDYKSGRRVALLINNLQDKFGKSNRPGAEYDMHLLAHTLKTQCGFEVWAVENVTKDGFHGLVKDFKEKAKGADACVVSVMSHGDKNHIYMVDGAIPIWTAIVAPFSNSNCESLRNKPKIFFIQCCRGGDKDYGAGTADDTTNEGDFDDAYYTIPSWSDILVAYSTMFGCLSRRQPPFGTWFIQILCHTIIKHGKDYDICALLQIVADTMKRYTDSDGRKQIPPFYNIGFTKRFRMIEESASVSGWLHPK